jgi:hypothetical protein
MSFTGFAAGQPGQQFSRMKIKFIPAFLYLNPPVPGLQPLTNPGPSSFKISSL